MKILVISDIHGNLAALEAVSERADMIFCLGDIVNYGPYPDRCIERIRGLTNTVVRGITIMPLAETWIVDAP